MKTSRVEGSIVRRILLDFDGMFLRDLITDYDIEVAIKVKQNDGVID